MPLRSTIALAAVFVVVLVRADDGFVPLFNEKDLSGWVNVNCAPGTFTVRDGLIVSTGIPTGVMRTDRQYENYILELEWRHMQAGGNAGLFVWSAPLTAPGQPFTRAIEVQILDGRNSETYTSHGDIFSIHGSTMKPDRLHPKGWARCLPSEPRCKPAGQWNHYRVTCNEGRVKLEVNGKEVSGGSECNYRKGYICLESEGSECHFRNLRIKVLPSTGAKPEETAPLAEGFLPLYTGVDLAGWRGDAGHWKPADWRLEYDGRSEAAEKSLTTTKAYRNFVLVADWRLPGKPKSEADSSGILLRGDACQIAISAGPRGSGEVRASDARAAIVPKTRADKPVGQWNRFEITLQKERLTVVLNGQTVVENALLSGLPEQGPIALQHRGEPIQFANLFVRELE